MFTILHEGGPALFDSNEPKEFEHNFMSLTFALATGVGKTKLLERFINERYVDFSKPTVGIELASKNFEYKD